MKTATITLKTLAKIHLRSRCEPRGGTQWFRVQKIARELTQITRPSAVAG